MDTETQSQTPIPQEVPRTFQYFLFDFLKFFLVAILIFVTVRWFLFQPFVVTGDSMRPNFQDGNYLIVDEISYRLRNPARGEVIVMRFPKDPKQFFIKRIVGLPGERVVVSEGQVTIYNSAHPSGLELKEAYLSGQNITIGNIDRKLGDTEYFVLGDNRLSSSDSRVWGPLPRQNIVGRVYLRLLPLEKINVFAPAPVYNN